MGCTLLGVGIEGAVVETLGTDFSEQQHTTLTQMGIASGVASAAVSCAGGE